MPEKRHFYFWRNGIWFTTLADMRKGIQEAIEKWIETEHGWFVNDNRGNMWDIKISVTLKRK